MPRPGIAPQVPQPLDQAAPERIQMEVAHQFHQVPFLFDHDGLVPILEEVAGPAVAPVEGPGVAGEEAPHAPGEGAGPGADQEVGVIREQGPGVDGKDAVVGEGREARDEVRLILAIPKDGAPLQAPHRHVVEGAGQKVRTKSGRSRGTVGAAWRGAAYHGDRPDGTSPILSSNGKAGSL